MRLPAIPLTLALGLVALTASAQPLPPPPPPPPTWTPAPPPPPPPREASRPAASATRPARTEPPPGTIGEAPVAPAGSQAAPLHPEEDASPWQLALATGVTGKFGGMQLEADRENPGVLLYFGGQADALWTEGYGRAARLRFRLFTGGESEIYIPSDGDVEAAFMIGRREFRFVVGRVEVGRYPALGVEVLAQVATLPCFEGSLPLAGDTMRLYYYLSPVEGTWVRYYGGAHIDSPGATSESERPSAATAGRLRYTLLLPPSIHLSLQGDFMKVWDQTDLLLSGEGSLGYQALDRSAVFNVAVRWNSFTRRDIGPGSSENESEVMLLATATLVL